jgi:hypothetical protein
VFFLRDTADPEDDLRRGWSGSANHWFRSEADALAFRAAVPGGCGMGVLRCLVSGMWNADPETGLSSYAFGDAGELLRAWRLIAQCCSGEAVALFWSDDYDLGAGMDGEDCFRPGAFLGWVPFGADFGCCWALRVCESGPPGP